MTQKKEGNVITGCGIYTTRRGNVAFIDGCDTDVKSGELLCYGEIIVTRNNARTVRRLIWLASGHCVTTGDPDDHIVWQA